MFDKTFAASTNNNAGINEHSKRRYASRSLSLSLGTEQIHENMAHRSNIVNGAISVEELESPVMGMPPRRSRYHSSSESTTRSTHSPNLPLLEESIFSKLLGKMPTSSFENKGLVPPHAMDIPESRDVTTTIAISTSAHPKLLQRSQSNPGDMPNYAPISNASQQNNSQTTTAPLPFASSLPPLSMPTLHENLLMVCLLKVCQ